MMVVLVVYGDKVTGKFITAEEYTEQVRDQLGGVCVLHALSTICVVCSVCWEVSQMPGSAISAQNNSDYVLLLLLE
jgi:hypothetical protein